MSLQKGLITILFAAMLALPLAGCGKKSPPRPPSGDEAPFPRPYPAPSPPPSG